MAPTIGTRTLVVLALMAMVGAACGNSGPDGTAGDRNGLGGAVNISGSSTVEPISALNAERYSRLNPGVAISVEGPGTGDGFALFCTGETDISNASRAIKESEAETCAANGIEWIELVVATDGLSVITSNENDFIDCIGTNDLYALLGPESIGFGTWADANDLAAELGPNKGPYPDEDLTVTAPGEESGTFDTFVEFLIEGLAGGPDFAEERDADTVRPDYVASANDNTIIEGISGAKGSLGWVGYAFFVPNQDKVKVLAVDAANDGNCVAPSPETIASGDYAFARPLYLYVSAGAAASKPEVAAYVDFYLSEEGLASVDETGYIRLADYGPTREAWESRATG